MNRDEKEGTRLKWALSMQCVGWIQVAQDSVAGYTEHMNETLDPIKGAESFDQLGDNQLLKEDSPLLFNL